MRRPLINWRLFLILEGIGVAASAAGIPFAMALGTVTAEQLVISESVTIVLYLLITALLYAVAIFVGLYLAQIVGFEMPLLSSIHLRSIPADLRKKIGLSFAAGAATAVVIVAMDILFFDGLVLDRIRLYQAASPWARVLLAFYAGFGEEVLFRLVFMTAVVWITWKLKAKPDGKPTELGVWTAIIAAALLFGLGHIPAAESLAAISPIVLFRALLLNGIAGVLLGWLYWRWGFETAVIAHFSADITIYAVIASII